jgi:hypothetical protein
MQSHSIVGVGVPFVLGYGVILEECLLRGTTKTCLHHRFMCFGAAAHARLQSDVAENCFQTKLLFPPLEQNVSHPHSHLVCINASSQWQPSRTTTPRLS